jgi:hypothetical protein
MYSKVAQIFAVASMVTFVAAIPSPQGGNGAYVECGNGGAQQCCMSKFLLFFFPPKVGDLIDFLV